MERADKIASRGWLGSAISILTFGYFDGESPVLVQGRMCVSLSMLIPGGAMAIDAPGGMMAITAPHITMAMSITGGNMSIATPGGTISIEAC